MGVEAVGQRGDEAVEADDAQDPIDRAGVDRFAERQVETQVGVERVGRLAGGGDPAAQGAGVVRPDGGAVDPDATGQG